MKNSLSNSLFSSESSVFYHRFLPSLKNAFYGFIYLKNRGLGRLINDVGSILN